MTVLALIKKHKNDLALHSNAFKLNKQIMYGVRDRIEIGTRRYYSYLYLDEKRRVEEREGFLSNVLEIEKKVEEPQFLKNREDLEEFLSDSFRSWKKIFEIIEYDGLFRIKRREKEINEQLEKMETMILLSNRPLEGKEVLHFYRRKDVSENFFDNMKHDIERKRLRIHTQETFDRASYPHMAEISWTAEAEKWLQDIYDYIARDNPNAEANVIIKGSGLT